MYIQKIVIQFDSIDVPTEIMMGDAVQALNNTCVRVNASDRRTAIASRVIRPMSPTSPASTVAPIWSIITPSDLPDPIKAYAVIASRVITLSSTEL